MLCLSLMQLKIQFYKTYTQSSNTGILDGTVGKSSGERLLTLERSWISRIGDNGHASLYLEKKRRGGAYDLVYETHFLNKQNQASSISIWFQPWFQQNRAHVKDKPWLHV